MKKKHKKILVAMSGGVDSSVAAYLLQKEGFEVGGATIRTWASGDCAEKNTRACCGIIGVEDSRAVARKLDIPYHVFNFEDEFKTHVVDYFSNEYMAGRTPNPCIACNEHIKFKLFLKRAVAMGYDAIATGHYAQIEFDETQNRYFIREGNDPAKDQSYVLFPLDQSFLQDLYLPVGGFTKPEIRQIARDAGLVTSDKPDSQEICFIPSNDYGAFLKRQRGLADAPGPIIDKNGTQLGTHNGYYHYTVGQREGLGVAYKHALYVTRILPDTNTIIVGTKEDTAGQTCLVKRINWFKPVHEEMHVEAKIRSKHKKASALLRPVSEKDAEIVFAEPQDAITPGQACVFYDGPRVIGGGWIEKSN